MCEDWILYVHFYFFFFKQKTAYEMRISDWSSDVCSSDLSRVHRPVKAVRVESARSNAALGADETPCNERRKPHNCVTPCPICHCKHPTHCGHWRSSASDSVIRR